MESIAVRLNPQLLDNPDLDIRYRLPEILAERSAGAIIDDGYDYDGEQPMLVVVLRVSQLQPALDCIIDVIENVPVCDCNLKPGAVVTVQHQGQWKVIWP